MYFNKQSLFKVAMMVLVVLNIWSCTQEAPQPTTDSSKQPALNSPLAVNRMQNVFTETNGRLTIESENAANIPAGWAVRSDVAGFNGAGYIQWQGQDFFGQPGNGLITYKIKINTPGTYQVQWRSRINQGNNGTEHNDAWLRFTDAADFFGKKGNNSIVYPRGSGKTPNPKGSSSNGWFKVYMNQLNAWSLQTTTSDNDPHKIFVVFAQAGEYTMEVSGRSKGYAIDQISLIREGAGPGPTPTDFSGSFHIKSRHSGKFLTVQEGSTLDGGNITQDALKNDQSQKWNITKVGNGVYKIINQKSNKGLDIKERSEVNGGNVQQWTYFGGSNQKFKIESTSAGHVKITALHSNKVVDVSGVSKLDGANIHQWKYLGANNQQWLLEKLQ